MSFLSVSLILLLFYFPSYNTLYCLDDASPWDDICADCVREILYHEEGTPLTPDQLLLILECVSTSEGFFQLLLFKAIFKNPELTELEFRIFSEIYCSGGDFFFEDYIREQ